MWRSTVQECGFAIIPGIMPHAEVDLLLDALARGPLERSKAGIRHALAHASVARLARDPRLREIAEGILGEGAFPFRATLFDKSPTANWLVVWHQDTALPLRTRCETPGWGPWSVKQGVSYAHAPASALSKILALRVHLDDSNSENGPLRVLPGTHALGVLTDEKLHELSTTVSAVECLVPEGGVLAMRPLLVHSSSKLETQAPRRVLHIEYAASRAVGDGLELAIA
jgi:ectoine hydroxylase-related dioxygenase (phytanoyl-CoA dioxygenase family)